MPIPEPRIYSCAEWGARPPQHGFEETDPDHVVVHHTADPNRIPIADPHAALAHAFQLARGYQSSHMDGNGWSDTGQNFTVTREGIILEGRHGSLAAARAGHSVSAAHCPGANYCPGIETEGTYTSELPPPAQRAALVDLLAWLCAVDQIDTQQIRGHRDFIATACPGDALYADLPNLRAEAHARKLQLLGKS